MSIHTFDAITNLVSRWSQPIIVRKYPAAAVIDYEFKVGDPTESTICGVVKPVTQKLIANNPGDWSECDLAILTTENLTTTQEGGEYSDFIVYKSKEYKIIMKVHNTVSCVKMYGISSHNHDDLRATP